MMIAVFSVLFFSENVASNPVSPGGITEFSVDPDWIEVHLIHWSAFNFKKPIIVDGKEVMITVEYNPGKLGGYAVFDSTNTTVLT